MHISDIIYNMVIITINIIFNENNILYVIFEIMCYIMRILDIKYIIYKEKNNL